MRLPFYKELDALPTPDVADMHMGLWFERYFDGYAENFCKLDAKLHKLDDKESKERTAWSKALITNSLGQKAGLQTKAECMRDLVTAQSGQVRQYHCEGNFVTGMGNPHPLENGFTWHPTLGMPYLPGSAVKGLMRAAIENAYQGEDKAAVLKRWFGTETKGDVAEASGCFIFFDALPTAPCELLPEVMTPHMGKWYEKGGKEENVLRADTQPGDWHSPVPVGYLIARNLKLQFAIAPRAGALAPQNVAGELENVWQALDYALQWLGAGGKTALGYGRMQIDERAERQRAAAQQEAAQAARMASLSPAQQRIEAFVNELRTKHEQFPNFKEGPNAAFHTKARELAKAAHEGGDWSAEEKLAAALAIEEWLPKLVRVDIKDERKKLKLGALKGQ